MHCKGMQIKIIIPEGSPSTTGYIRSQLHGTCRTISLLDLLNEQIFHVTQLVFKY